MAGLIDRPAAKFDGQRSGPARWQFSPYFDLSFVSSAPEPDGLSGAAPEGEPPADEPLDSPADEPLRIGELAPPDCEVPPALVPEEPPASSPARWQAASVDAIKTGSAISAIHRW